MRGFLGGGWFFLVGCFGKLTSLLVLTRPSMKFIAKKVLIFSRVLSNSTPRLFGWSVGPSIRPSHFTFFVFLRSSASLLLPKWSSDLKYGLCPPARDFGSRVSGLVPVDEEYPVQKGCSSLLINRFLEWLLDNLMTWIGLGGKLDKRGCAYVIRNGR